MEQTVLNQLLIWCKEFEDKSVKPTFTNMKEKIWQLLPVEQQQISSAYEKGGLDFHGTNKEITSNDSINYFNEIYGQKLPSMKPLLGGLDKYFDDLEEYENDLYCSHCGNDSKKTFTYSRTVANGEVFFCHICNEENIVGDEPKEDNY